MLEPLAEAVLTSTHNLCFGAKIRKIGIPLQTPVFLYKIGVEGVYLSCTCFPDGAFIYFDFARHVVARISTLYLWDIGKQNSPRFDAAERGVPSGVILVA